MSPRGSAKSRSSPGFLLIALAGLYPSSSAVAAYTGGATGGFTVAPSSREQSRQFYNIIHEMSDETPANWTGSISPCNPGTTADNFKKAVIMRVNYFRAMAGSPAAVALKTDFNTGAQKAALMMAANGQTNHTPPASWTCYTAEGASFAAGSNLTVDAFGPKGVDIFMSDHEDDDYFVGHRRWVILPQTQEMGTGDIPPAATTALSNVLVIADGRSNNPRPATRENYIAWPPPGYVPWQVVFARWSFGLGGADLSAMTVTVKQGATTVPVTLEANVEGAGENTRAWKLTGLDYSAGPSPAADAPHTITVSGVKVGGVTQSPFIYTVTVINPATTGADTVVTSLTGPAALNAGQAGSYTHPLVSFAQSYDLVEAGVSPSFSEIEGAENGLANMTASGPAGYNPVSTTVSATGTKSFHLTNPDRRTQSLMWQRTLLPSATSHLQFKGRFRFTAPAQTALAQVSKNGGVSWTDVYSESRNITPDNNFVQKDISLAAFAGYPVMIRFCLKTPDGSGAIFNNTDDTYGWYVDDITVTGASLLTNPAVLTNNTGGTLSYTPAATGQRALYAQPLVFQGYPMDNGPALLVTVSPGTASAVLKVTSWSRAGGQVNIDFNGTGLPASPVFKLQTSSNLTAAWTDVSGATLQNLGSGNYRFSATSSAATRAFYRVALN